MSWIRQLILPTGHSPLQVKPTEWNFYSVFTKSIRQTYLQTKSQKRLKEQQRDNDEIIRNTRTQAPNIQVLNRNGAQRNFGLSL